MEERKEEEPQMVTTNFMGWAIKEEKKNQAENHSLSSPAVKGSL